MNILNKILASTIVVSTMSWAQIDTLADSTNLNAQFGWHYQSSQTKKGAYLMAYKGGITTEYYQYYIDTLGQLSKINSLSTQSPSDPSQMLSFFNGKQLVVERDVMPTNSSRTHRSLHTHTEGEANAVQMSSWAAEDVIGIFSANDKFVLVQEKFIDRTTDPDTATISLKAFNATTGQQQEIASIVYDGNEPKYLDVPAVHTKNHVLFKIYDTERDNCAQSIYSWNGSSSSKILELDCNDETHYLFGLSQSREGYMIPDSSGNCVYFDRSHYNRNDTPPQTHTFYKMRYCEDTGLETIYQDTRTSATKPQSDTKLNIIDNVMYFNAVDPSLGKKVFASIDLATKAYKVVSTDTLFQEMIKYKGSIYFSGATIAVPNKVYLFKMDPSTHAFVKVEREGPYLPYGGWIKPRNFMIANDLLFFNADRESTNSSTGDYGTGLYVHNAENNQTLRLPYDPFYRQYFNHTFNYGDFLLFASDDKRSSNAAWIFRYNFEAIPRLYDRHMEMDSTYRIDLGTEYYVSDMVLKDTLTLVNIGSDTLKLDDSLFTTIPESKFRLLSSDSFTLATGDSSKIIISWAPDAPLTQEDTVSLRNLSGETLMKWPVKAKASVQVPSSLDYNLIEGRISPTSEYLEYQFYWNNYKDSSGWKACTNDTTSVQFPTEKFDIFIRVKGESFSYKREVVDQAEAPRLAINFGAETLSGVQLETVEYSWTRDFSSSWVGDGTALDINPEMGKDSLFARTVLTDSLLISPVSAIEIPERSVYNSADIEIDFEKEETVKIWNNFEAFYVYDTVYFDVSEERDTNNSWITDGNPISVFTDTTLYIKPIFGYTGGFAPKIPYYVVKLPKRPSEPQFTLSADNASWTAVEGYEEASDYEVSLDSGKSWDVATSMELDGNYDGVDEVWIRVKASNTNKNFSGEIAKVDPQSSNINLNDLAQQNILHFEVFNVQGQLMLKVLDFDQPHSELKARLNVLPQGRYYYVATLVGSKRIVRIQDVK